MTVPKAGRDGQYQALLQLLRTSEALWEASRVLFARWDISPSQFNILNLLSDFPEGCSQVALSEALIMHRSNVTGLVRRLERRKLVMRRGDSLDKRAMSVKLSPSGNALLQDILPAYHRAAAEVWDGVGANQVEVMTQGLEKIRHNAVEMTVRNVPMATPPVSSNSRRKFSKAVKS